MTNFLVSERQLFFSRHMCWTSPRLRETTSLALWKVFAIMSSQGDGLPMSIYYILERLYVVWCKWKTHFLVPERRLFLVGMPVCFTSRLREMTSLAWWNEFEIILSQRDRVSMSTCYIRLVVVSDRRYVGWCKCKRNCFREAAFLVGICVGLLLVSERRRC